MAIIYPQIKSLATQRRSLAHGLRQLTAASFRDQAGASRPPVCYDNRYSADYYQQREKHCQKLLAKNKRSRADNIEIITQALSDDYRDKLYLELDDKLLLGEACQQPRPGDPEKLIFWLIAQGGGSLTLGISLPTAEKYLHNALTLLMAPPPTLVPEVEVLRGQIYNYQAMLAEARQDFSTAARYLDKAISVALGDSRPPALNIKYLYLRRAMAYEHIKEYGAALDDLTHALNYRKGLMLYGPIYRLDKLIIWEQIKIFITSKDFPAAQKNLKRLHNLIVLTKAPDPGHPDQPPRALLSVINDLISSIPSKKSGAPAIPDYYPRPTSPEARGNYLSYQVNAKCDKYQEFIAKLYAKPQKSLRAWKYLVVYEFALFADPAREYDDDFIIPAAPTTGNPKRWWILGVYYLYVERDYHKADEIFTRQLKRRACLTGYELAAKTKLALRDYKAVPPLIAKGIKLQEESHQHNPGLPGDRELLDTYLLLRGIAYGKLNRPAAALKDFNRALATPKPGVCYKLTDILLWERAQVHLRRGEITSALRDLQDIKQNGACEKYLDELRRK